MKKKYILRLFLIIFLFLTISFAYFKFTKKEKVVKKEDIIENTIEGSNILKDVSYSSKDTRGNEFNLEAEEGVIDQNENNFIFLTNIKANLNLQNYDLIEISSDFGKYNINNYDTIFSKNVIIIYLDYIIKGDYLDFSWDKNFMMISKNVILKNRESSLKADVIEINIEKKDIKIFMYEQDKKVNIKSLN